MFSHRAGIDLCVPYGAITCRFVVNWRRVSAYGNGSPLPSFLLGFCCLPHFSAVFSHSVSLPRYNSGFFFQCFLLFDFFLPPLCFNPVSFSNVSLSFSSCWHDGVLHACVCFSLLFPVSSFSSSSSFLLLSAADTANIFNKHFSTVTARLRLPEMTICFFVLPPCDMAVLCSTEKEKRNHRGK